MCLHICVHCNAVAAYWAAAAAVAACMQAKQQEIEEAQQQLADAQAALSDLQASFELVIIACTQHSWLCSKVLLLSTTAVCKEELGAASAGIIDTACILATGDVTRAAHCYVVTSLGLNSICLKQSTHCPCLQDPLSLVPWMSALFALADSGCRSFDTGGAGWPPCPGQAPLTELLAGSYGNPAAASAWLYGGAERVLGVFKRRWAAKICVAEGWLVLRSA
jgi:hypothetical protein